MTKNILLLLVSSLMLLGCSDDPYEKYLGLWERQRDGDRYEVMEITKDGETILVNEKILSEKSKPLVLKKSEGQLSIDMGFGGPQFGLSENEDILRVANQSYKRIDIDRLNEIKLDIKKRKEEREKNKKMCDALKDEYEVENKTISDTHRGDWNEIRKRHKKLDEQYEIKEKAIPNCRVRGFRLF